MDYYVKFLYLIICYGICFEGMKGKSIFLMYVSILLNVFYKVCLFFICNSIILGNFFLSFFICLF